MKCPRCQQDNPSHAGFCLKCGTPVDGRAPIAKSSADLTGEIDRLKGSLGEALKREAEAQEQQTATAEILRLISSSPTSVGVLPALWTADLFSCHSLGAG
jgi:hypothetical protein